MMEEQKREKDTLVNKLLLRELEGKKKNCHLKINQGINLHFVLDEILLCASTAEKEQSQESHVHLMNSQQGLIIFFTQCS